MKKGVFTEAEAALASHSREWHKAGVVFPDGCPECRALILRIARDRAGRAAL